MNQRRHPIRSFCVPGLILVLTLHTMSSESCLQLLDTWGDHLEKPFMDSGSADVEGILVWLEDGERRKVNMWK